MNKIKFLVLLMVSLFAMEGMAQEIDRAHWMEQLVKERPDVRFSQLSIPGAHDAATWDAASRLWADQKYDEKTLFVEHGIRYFDCRIAYDEYNDIIDGDVSVGHFRHGDFAWNGLNNLNNLYDEIMYHFPSKSDIGNECLILRVAIEGWGNDDVAKTENKTKAIDQFVQFLLKKYDDIFAEYKPDIKLKDLQGKILLFAEKGLISLCNYNNRINMNVKDGSGIYSYLNDAEKSSYSEYSNSSWGELSIDELENECKDHLKKFWGKIDAENSKNVIAETQLNNWEWYSGGMYYSADDIWVTDHGDKGMNHRMYEYLSQYRSMPLSIISHDFCGLKEHPLQDAFGKQLDDEIIMHNFVKGKFIKELRLAADKEEGVAKSLLTKQGYTVIDYDLNKGCGNGSYYIFLGVKYTNNRNDAIQDIVVRDLPLKYNSANYGTYRHDEKDYTRVEGDLRGGTFYGNANYLAGEGGVDHGDKIFIYVTKQGGPSPVTDVRFIKDDEDLVEDDEDLSFVTVASFESDDDCHVSDMNQAAGPTIRMLMCRHMSDDDHIYNDEFDLGVHWKQCIICNQIKNKGEHLFDGFVNVMPGTHKRECKDCDYVQRTSCRVPEFAFKNGFATCDDCGKEVYEKPELVNNVYQIGNAGQLYWFANHVNTVSNYVDAILTNDICINENVYLYGARTWTPIAGVSRDVMTIVNKAHEKYNTDDEKRNKYIKEELGKISQPSQFGYSGTFDGNGYTISGLRSNEDYCGLFYYIMGGTVKNLGIINSRFMQKSGDFAVYADNAKLNNVFSTADVCDKSSGMIYDMRKSELKNGYHSGNLDPAFSTYITQWNDFHNKTYNPENVVVNFYGREFRDSYGAEGLTLLTDEQFKDGTLCRKLNDIQYNSEQIWQQDINTDRTPVLRGKDGSIKYVGYAHGSTEPKYFDSPEKMHRAPYNPSAQNDTRGNHDTSYKFTNQLWIPYSYPPYYYYNPGAIFDARLECSVCGDIQERELQPDEIEHDDRYTDIIPTCTEDGCKYFKATIKFNNFAVFTSKYIQTALAKHPNQGHSFAADGFGCTECGADDYQPAELIDKETNTYQISNAGQLYWFSQYCNTENKDTKGVNAVLKNDIVVNEDMTLNASSLRTWTPICTGKRFSGTFDGQGHTISGLYDGEGLFSRLNGGTIKNLGLINSIFKGNEQGTGAIVANAINSSLENVYSTADLQINSLWIALQEESWDHYSYAYSGGLYGYLYNSTVTNAFYDGNIQTDMDKYTLYLLPPENCNTKTYYVRKNGKNTYKYCLGATILDDADFASGKLTLLLNNEEYGKDAVWHQNIDASDVNGDYKVDATPVLNRNHDMVVPAKYNGKDFINLHVINDGDDVKYYRDMFEVTDQTDFYCPVDFAVMDAKQSRDMKGYTWGTVCLPFNIDNAENSGVKLYKPVKLNTSGAAPVLVLEEIDELEAGTPAVFYKLDKEKNDVVFVCNEGCTVKASDEKSQYTYSPTAGLSLIGTFTQQPVYQDDRSPVYYYSPSQNQFTKVNKNITVDPFRAWVETDVDDALSHAEKIIVEYDSPVMPDGIEVIDAENMNIPMYDISGRRVIIPFKGKIIIRNGKKTLYNNK